MTAIIIGTLIAAVVTAANIIVLVKMSKHLEQKFEKLADVRTKSLEASVDYERKAQQDLTQKLEKSTNVLHEAMESNRSLKRKLVEAREETERYKQALNDEREGHKTVVEKLMAVEAHRKELERRLAECGGSEWE